MVMDFDIHILYSPGGFNNIYVKHLKKSRMHHHLYSQGVYALHMRL